MASFTKELGNKPAVQNLAASLVAGYIRLLHMTSKWEVLNQDVLDKLEAEGTPFIAAAWHGRILMMPYVYPHPERASVLISNNRDGEIIARVIARFGYGSIRGSSANKKKDKDKGGGAALRLMLKALKRKEIIMITPDGPRGPRMRAKDGMITLARLTGAPIVPVTYSTKRRKVVSSWDRFVLPKLFTRGVYAWGDPITIPRTATDEDCEVLLRDVEQKMIDLSQQVDAYLGQESIEPAPLEGEQTTA